MSHSTATPAQSLTACQSGAMVPADSNPLPGFGQARLIAISPRLSA